MLNISLEEGGSRFDAPRAVQRINVALKSQLNFNSHSFPWVPMCDRNGSTTSRKTAVASWLSIYLPLPKGPYLAPGVKWGKDDVILVCTAGGRRSGRRRHGALLGGLAKLSVPLPAIEPKLTAPLVQHVTALPLLGGP